MLQYGTAFLQVSEARYDLRFSTVETWYRSLSALVLEIVGSGVF